MPGTKQEQGWLRIKLFLRNNQMDPEDWLPAEIPQPLVRAQNPYVPLVKVASLMFGLLAHRSRGVSHLPVTSPMPDNDSK